MHTAIQAANIYYFEYYPDEDYALEYYGREKFGLMEREDNYPNSWFEKKITHPEDAHILRKAFLDIKNGASHVCCDVRNDMEGEYRWYHYNMTSIYDKNGKRTKIVCTAQDITESKKVEELNDSFNQLYTRTPGWIFTCKSNLGWPLKQTNSRIYEATGYTEETFAKELNSEIAQLILEEYHPMIQEHVQQIQKKGYGSTASYEAPIRCRDGSISWFNVDLYWDRDEDDGILYVACADITKIKKHEEELRESNAMYQLTTREANINLWKYDVVNDVMYNTDSSIGVHMGDESIPNFVSTSIREGYIRPDCIRDFISMYEQLKSGVQSVTADIWFRNREDTDWWCERITYAAILDKSGKPDKAFGIGRDVTELKEAEEKLKAEQEFQDGIENEKLLLKTRCNITQDKVELLDAKPEMQVPNPAKTFNKGVEQLAEHAYSQKDAQLILKKLSKETMEDALKNSGRYNFQYLRKDSRNRANWISVQVRVLSQPETHDTIAFVYFYDINAEKKMTAIVNRVAEVDYEALALIYSDTDEIEPIRIQVNANDAMAIDFFLPYSQAIEKLVNNCIEKSQREEARNAFAIANIREKLQDNAVYEVTFAMKGNNMFQKKWEFAYFDDTRTTIIYSRTDITELFREQEIQREALQNALLQAEEASKAKTNFLSRMSHEIRTPMNAIIGMNTLAAQVLDRPNEVRDCLAKVGISARFLLSLINDILDMSRIESGKVTLNKRKFPLEEMVNSINSIFYEQASQKGIDYDCIIASFVSDFYVGDSMKLQQILVNLLGNAIKFTQSGGKVQLIIRQERVQNGKAYMCFSVNDTGVGISEELQKKMFEPFEQGDTSTTSPYKGTGLGLAIAKNLVQMMEGTIAVNSIEGVGTEFVVRVPLDVCEDENKYRKLQLNQVLPKLKTLIVDDDITICEHTRDVLMEMGMKAEWVESGYRAVELIQTMWNKKDFFDIVLLDWKMPDMNGIETARRIRRIVGNEVTIIVMTAYDWTQIEQEAKQAGVNLLVTKPLFKSSLISVFERVFQRKEEQHVQVKPLEYDFSGKHILLVEDHILNVEIAKKLLEKKNAEISVAENGLRSIEMFMEAEDNYYDLILMDIRMPVMDGLTATKSIRHLHKTSAKTIPIIAMSANAFEEDVEKSKAAGMNEHLSKPIEPALLYATVNKWLLPQEE
ncbi:MAG: response regulator [Lachnospiraceae bacterium]|nr:response regulator [Lachnospiraceae bacterium]